MNKLLICCMMLVSLFVYRCSQMPDNPVEASGQTKSITIAIATPDGFDTIAQSAIVHVIGAGMDTIKSKLAISSSSISGRVDNIPLGKNRYFEVLVYGYTGKVVYYGSDYADINAGVTYINITLRSPAGGSAIINGTILDTFSVPISSIDSFVYKLAGNDSLMLKINPFDTITIRTTGTWCISKDICCSSRGDCTLDKKNFVFPDFCGGALLVYHGDFLLPVGESITIANDSQTDALFFLPNQLKPGNQGIESGLITLFIIIRKGVN